MQACVWLCSAGQAGGGAPPSSSCTSALSVVITAVDTSLLLTKGWWTPRLCPCEPVFVWKTNGVCTHAHACGKRTLSGSSSCDVPFQCPQPPCLNLWALWLHIWLSCMCIYILESVSDWVMVRCACQALYQDCAQGPNCVINTSLKLGTLAKASLHHHEEREA
jgi:hypothetical protein